MPGAWWILAGLGAAAAVGLLWRPSRAVAREAQLVRARRAFHRRREWLEVKFIRLARERSHKRVQWTDCEFHDDVAYVRNRHSGELGAFVGVTVPVENSVGHDAPDEDDGPLRIGTAIFRFDRDHWETDGRAIFNLHPGDVIRVYQDDLEVFGQEVGGSNPITPT